MLVIIEDCRSILQLCHYGRYPLLKSTLWIHWQWIILLGGWKCLDKCMLGDIIIAMINAWRRAYAIMAAGLLARSLTDAL